jgi:hypothetical protein
MESGVKLWLVTQDEASGYDTYDAMVVAAASEADAKSIHPCGHSFDGRTGVWCSSPDKATAECIGEADGVIERGVILASFRWWSSLPRSRADVGTALDDAQGGRSRG